MQTNNQLQRSRLDLKQLIQTGALPPKMELKLLYLESCITSEALEPKLADSLPQFQRNSLESINAETKIQLFNSILRCLTGRQQITFFSCEPTSFKKESSRSIHCFITCNTNTMTVLGTRDGSEELYRFSIDKLLVAKIYHAEKKKFIFGISYENVMYRLKFQVEGLCARIHGALLTAIKQKKILISKNKIELFRYSMREEVERQDFWDDGLEDRILEEEKIYLMSLCSKIEEVQTNDDFLLLKNMQNGKILTNRMKNQTKILIFAQGCSIEGLIQTYLQLGQWNKQVQSFDILSRIRSNTFLAHLKLKRKSMLSAPREAYFTINYLKLCSCLHQNSESSNSKLSSVTKHYLIMNKVQNETSFGYVNMAFNQIIEFSPSTRAEVVFINCMSSIDFNGYSYLQNNADDNIKFMEDVRLVATLCSQKEKIQPNTWGLFDFDVCICDRKKRRINFEQIDFSEEAKIQSEQDGDNEPQKQKLIPQELSQNAIMTKQTMRTIDSHNRLVKSQHILEIIQKKIFQFYYLKSHFPEGQKIHSQHKQGTKQETNYLMLGSRWKLHKDEYIYIDEQSLKIQKGVIKLILKQVTSNLMAGKSLMSMSLPVQLFDTHSALEGFANYFSFIPTFMPQALKQPLPEQIKYVALGLMSMLTNQPNVCKPFNPILGQTYEGIIGGIPIYLQQICHHPPIAAFLMKTEQFQVSGNIGVDVDVGFNSAVTKLLGSLTLKIYHNNTEYKAIMPELEIGGVMFGDRTYRLCGRGYVLEINSNTYLEYGIGKERKKIYQYKQKIKSADLTGGIFTVTPQAIQRILSIDRKKSFEGIKVQQVLQKQCLITGKWYGDILFDNIEYKSVKNGPFPLQIVRPSLLLPSDCTFRLDIVYRRWSNFQKSNQEKEILENAQRRDRKLREQNHTK